MLRLRIDPEKPYRAPFICQDGLCCCNMALISFRLFRKNLGNLRDFFGQMVYRPSLAKNFPYAYGWEFVWEMKYWGLRTINIVILNKEGLSLLHFCVFRGELLNSVTFWLYCVTRVAPFVLWMELQWLADSYRQLACFKPYVRWPLQVHPRRRLDLCVHLPR